jgi:hypothetical protein
MFEVIDLTLIDNDVQFTSTKRLMYGENIIRIKVKCNFEFDKHIYLNDESFTKLVEKADDAERFASNVKTIEI